MASIKPCSKCCTDFDVRPNWYRRNGNVCPSCQNARDAARRLRRKAEGRPVRTGKVSREYHVAYRAEYNLRPEVRARRAEAARKRLKDPVERVKIEARWATRRAIYAGTLVRQPCEVCGAVKVDAHHDDYAQPLNVRWLCRPHHHEHHAKARGETPSTLNLEGERG